MALPVCVPARDLRYTVDGFAAFLAQNKALASLLFWKEAEEYSCMFGDDERKQMAKKIYERYLSPGSEYEVTSLPAETREPIKAEVSGPHMRVAPRSPELRPGSRPGIRDSGGQTTPAHPAHPHLCLITPRLDSPPTSALPPLPSSF